MANPQTINVQLDVPLRGSNPGTWDLPVNFDFSAIDGLFGGVGNVGLSSGNVTLTAPAGTAAPGAGPYQSQNAVIRFTGALTADVTVTLPLACYNIFENLTTGAFNVILRAVGAGEVIALPPGCRTDVYNDGVNARFVTGIMGRPGALSFEAGEIALPAWMVACTVKPFLLCDGTVYNYSTYPYLGPKLGNRFGGNGITTFGVPDLSGRVPLAYDRTGARITVGGCGMDGQLLGSFLDTQINLLSIAQMPLHYHGAGISDPGHTHALSAAPFAFRNVDSGNGNVTVINWTGSPGTAQAAGTGVRVASTNGLDTTYSAGSSQPHNNVQPSLMTGVLLIKT